jgi:hypothetical protein
VTEGGSNITCEADQPDPVDSNAWSWAERRWGNSFVGRMEGSRSIRGFCPFSFFYFLFVCFSVFKFQFDFKFK